MLEKLKMVKVTLGETTWLLQQDTIDFKKDDTNQNDQIAPTRE